jgi:hypothetical protein
MLDAVLKIAPLLIVFLVGYGVKKAKFLSSDDGSSLLKLVFYVGAPALIFVSILKVKLDPSLLWLCVVSPAIIVVTLLIGYVLRRSLLRKLEIQTFGTLIIGATIMNLGFMIPFVQNLYGPEGLARLAIIDGVNGLICFSLIYTIAVKLGNDQPNLRFIAGKLLIAPALWAILLALVCKASGAMPPKLIMDACSMMASVVGPAVLLALGLKFSFKLQRPGLLVVPLALRFVVGGLIGFALVKLIGLHGLTAEVALMASAAPIGYYSITFSELEHLDVEFAISQVSSGLLVGLITVPFMSQLVSMLVG